jgi:isopentenyl-diphosphate delta-isomerase
MVDARAIDPLIPGISDDGSLYPIGKLEAHQRGVLHAAVSVFIFSGDRVLIQQRAAGKYHSGSLWANTCCTHPHWQEDSERAAHRRLEEELGIQVPLTAVGTFSYCTDVSRGLVENERVELFTSDVDANALVLAPRSSEVSATRWVDLNTLRSEMATQPSDFAPWFHIYVAHWAELGFSQ